MNIGSTTTMQGSPPRPQPIPNSAAQPAPAPNTETPIGIPPITNSIFYKHHSGGDIAGMVILGMISFAFIAALVWVQLHSKKDKNSGREMSWLWNTDDGRGFEVTVGLGIGAILSALGVGLVYHFQGNHKTPDERPGPATADLDAPVIRN